MKYVRALLVTLFATAMIAGTLAPADAETQARAQAPRRDSTFLVGDSTSWRLTGEYDGRANLFHKYDLDWYVDAKGGRNLLQLPVRILHYLVNVDSRPDTFVMALGTNPHPRFEKIHYELSLALLPRDTKVVLVTPAVFGQGREKSKTTARYSRWLRQIAEDRPHTVVADWRELVKQSNPNPHTGRSRLVAEGIHQTPITGRRAWIELVIDAVNSVR